MGLFFVISTLLIWGMCLTVWKWCALAFPALDGRLLTWLLPALVTLFICTGIAYPRTHYGPGWVSILYYAAYISFGFVFLAFCTTAVFALTQGILKLFHVHALQVLGPLSLLTMAIVFTMAVWGGFSQPKIKRIAVSVPGTPSLKIALLSDSHLGLGVSLSRFDKALARLEAEKPDVLFALGDIFEYGPNRLAYAQRLARFSAPLGKYGVLGNHEYYVGYGDSKEFFKEAGLTLLENNTATLSNGVQIAGLKDIHTAHVTPQEIAAVLNTLDKNRPTILLSHTPKYAEVAAENGANLMFSGHTHNGQIWPFNYLVRLQFPRVYGLFDVNGMKFYITSGMFYWGIPLRFLAPAELPIIEVN